MADKRGKAQTCPLNFRECFASCPWWQQDRCDFKRIIGTWTVRKGWSAMTGRSGQLIKQQRVMRGLTLGKLGALSGISPSLLGHIERGERFPSASILCKIANPLGLNEGELFPFAGFLSP